MKSFAFTKMFQPAPAQEAFTTIKNLGFDGLDLTVRKAGYVDPACQSFDEDFEQVAQIWTNVGIAPGMFTTDITNPDSAHAEAIIAAAAKYNVKYLKLGYCRVRFGHLAQDLDTWRKGVIDLVPLAEQYGVTLMLHVHSANFAGAVPFHWVPIFEQVSSPALAMYLDPCHMHIEGSLAGWVMALEMAREITAVVAVKDYRWFEPYRKADQGFVYPIFTKLQNGNTPWNQVVWVLKKFGFDGPFSFHGEYFDADRHDPALAMAADRDYFKKLWTTFDQTDLNPNTEKINFSDDE